MVLGYNVVKPGAGPYYRHFRALRRPFCAPCISIGSGTLFSAGDPVWKRFACRLHRRGFEYSARRMDMFRTRRLLNGRL